MLRICIFRKREREGVMLLIRIRIYTHIYREREREGEKEGATRIRVQHIFYQEVVLLEVVLRTRARVYVFNASSTMK